jgi:hypothetical protein
MRRIVVLTPAFCLGILLVFVLATGTTEFKDRWLQPCLFVLPLVFFILLEHRLDRPRQLALLGLGAAAAGIIVPLLFVDNRFPDALGQPSRVAAPFDALADEIRETGFTEGTIISPRSWVGGNLLFQIPAAKALTPEYSRLPLDYTPPFLLASDDDWEASRTILGPAFAAVCGKPLPTSLEPTTMSAPYVGSRRETYRLQVAIMAECAEPQP